MKTKVTNSRVHKKTAQVWRRHHCELCRHSATTYERVALFEELTIKNRRGKLQPYNLGVLLVDLHEALLRSSSEAAQDAFWLTRSIEDDLMVLGRQTITTTELKAIAHAALARFNTMAGIQYAAKHQLLDKIKRPRARS